MAHSLESLRQEVRQMPFRDRVELISKLEADLDADETVADNDIDAAWSAEEERRAQQVLAGTARLLSHDEFIRRLDEVRARYSP